MLTPTLAMFASPVPAPDQLAAINQWLASIHSLEDLARVKPDGPQTVAIIPMDEFTHDVIVHFDGPVHLVFDST